MKVLKTSAFSNNFFCACNVIHQQSMTSDLDKAGSIGTQKLTAVKFN